jgi:hypothetical protein
MTARLEDSPTTIPMLPLPLIVFSSSLALADPSSLTPSPPLLKISFLRRMTPSAPRTSTPAPEASWNLLLEMAVKSPVRVRAVSAPRAFTSNPTKSTFLATISTAPRILVLSRPAREIHCSPLTSMAFSPVRLSW